jgi:hexosaminidase
LVCTPARADSASNNLPNLIPWPKVLTPAKGFLEINAKSRVIAADKALEPLARIFSEEIEMVTGLRLAVAVGDFKPGDIVLRVNPALKADADIVTVQKREVTRTRDYAHTITVGKTAVVEGFDYRAVAEGTATLLQALRVEKGAVRLPAMAVKDWPEADFTAIMVDCGRQYIPISTLRQVVAACRVYKVRYLQLHLSDDQGWTFPSRAYPTLGSANGAAHGGVPPKVYDLEDLKALVAFADARGVTLVPELETPGHSSAARRAMPELFGALDAQGAPVDLPIMNIGNEKLYAALDTIVGEMCEVFKSSPYFHIGVDETRMGGVADLPEAKALMAGKGLTTPGELFNYFVCQMNEFAKKRGKKTIIWEGAGNGASKDIINMTWDGNARTAEALLPAGITTITVPWNLGVPWPEWTMYICNGSVLKRGDSVLGAMLPMWEMSAEALIDGYLPGIPKRQDRTWSPAHTFTEQEFEQRSKSTEAVVAKLISTVQIKAQGLFDIDARARSDKGNMFEDKLAVSFESVVKRGTIRYTVTSLADGSSAGASDGDPTAKSPAYAGPITLTNSATVKAAVFGSDGAQIGYAASRTYVHVSYEPNLTTGKPVTVSGGTEGANKPEYAADGLVLRDRAWWASPGPQWLKVDLEKTCTLNKAKIFPYWDGGRYYQYTLELSVDGQQWTQVVDMSGNTTPSTPDGTTLVFKPTPARYVRINMLKGSAFPAVNPVHLVELRVYEGE